MRRQEKETAQLEQQKAPSEEAFEAMQTMSDDEKDEEYTDMDVHEIFLRNYYPWYV